MNTRFHSPLKLCGTSIVIALLPAIPTLIAYLIADFFHCQLHEGFANPCVVLGVDIGKTLYPMGITAWFLFMSVPIGIIGILASAVWFVVALLKRNGA